MSTSPKIAPYGAWKSPISSSLLSGGAVSFADLLIHPETHDIYLIENRPDGLGVVISVDESGSTDILPKGVSARAKLHACGGGAACFSANGHIIFADAATDRVSSLSVDGKIEEILAQDQATKTFFADFDASPVDSELVIAIKQTHPKDGEPVDTIALINTKLKTSTVIVEGADFYSNPRFSSDGRHISWTQWNHPDMPWTGAQLYVAEFTGEGVVNEVHIAGQSMECAVCQPRWSPNGKLWFVDEPEGIWQMYTYDLATKAVEDVRIPGYENCEMGMADWWPGIQTYAFLDEDTLVISCIDAGVARIIIYDARKKTATELPLDITYVYLSGLRRVSSTSFAVVGGTAIAPGAIYLIDITRPKEKKILKSVATVDLPSSIFSQPQAITIPRTHGSNLPSQTYAVFAPPHNPDFRGPDDSLPPLIMDIHGGPTAHDPSSLRLEAQYFTSRGYAYVYLNYAGSTGYGRAYRNEINGSWGIKDVEDALSCIDHLASQNKIDRKRVAIRGESAGGYTVLQALVHHPKVFAAGCSLYGIGDMKKLCEETHKFEAHYNDHLLFTPDLTDEEKQAVLKDRSPCFQAHKIETPIVLFQGSEDNVVAPAQASDMERVLKEGGKDVTLFMFEGEGHGFRMEENVKKRIEEEEALYQRTLVA